MAGVTVVEVDMAEAAGDRVAERVVMVAGATGLVGREVLAALLADDNCKAVHTLGRKPPSLQHPKLTAHVVDFTRLPKLPRIDEAYIALGTTIKVAGSQQAFREVDFDAVVAVARAARAAGATRLGLVSAMGADPASGVFYNRVKGEAEAALQTLGLPSLVVARPSMLAGDRTSLGQAERLGERLGLLLMSAFKPMLPRNYRAIAARDVAHALITAVAQGKPGLQVLLSGDMQPA